MSTTAFGQENAVDTPTEVEQPKLASRLGRRKIDEALIKARHKQYRELPSGVFRAPKIDKVVQRIVARFAKTNLVVNDAVFETFLASTPAVNAWVSQVPDLPDTKAFHVVVTKGLLDLITSEGIAREKLGVDFSTFVAERSESILAAVIAHETGHAMLGHTSEPTPTRGPYHELDADTFAVKLLSEAGYDPRAMVWVLEVFDRLRGDPAMKDLLKSAADDHPNPRMRIANIQQLVETLARISHQP